MIHIKKPTLCLIFGGKSNEYEVSLRSAYAVLENINADKYEIITIGITKDGKWYLYTGDYKFIADATWQEKGTVPITVDFSNSCFITTCERDTLYPKNICIKPDVVFPVMHGSFGEDGVLQGILEAAGMRFVGCKALSSAVCMDKYTAKLTAGDIGIPCAKAVTICKDNKKSLKKIKIPLPVFVKPSRSGSSVGVSQVENQSDMNFAVEEAFKWCSRVIVEEKIVGKEVEVALMQKNGELLISEVGEIKHNSGFYDYDTKYKSRDVGYIIPAEISDASKAKIKKYAKQLFSALECSGLCRMDFFVKECGDVVFNEVNTMPGFTDISMFPMLFMHAGFSFSEIIDILVSER